MQHIITSNIARLVLHDSTFEEMDRNNEAWVLVFDWAKFVNFIENDIEEPIIMGKTTMRLTGVHLEEFRLYNEKEGYNIAPFSADFAESMIALNEIDDANKTIKITGFYDVPEKSMNDWAEWCFHFDTCEVTFDSYITQTEWLNGKLPDD